MKLWTARFANKNLKHVTPGAAVSVYGICLSPPRFPLGYKLAGNIKQLGPPKILWGQGREAFAVDYTAFLAQRAEYVLHLANDWKASDGHIVLCCYEDLRDSDKHCHRTVLAEWLRHNAALEVTELPEDPQVAKDGGFPVELSTFPAGIMQLMLL